MSSDPNVSSAGAASLQTSPQVIASGVTNAVVNILINENGKLQIKQEKTNSNEQTVQTIASAQKLTNAVAVGLDRPAYLETTNDPLVQSGSQWSYSTLDYGQLATKGQGRKVAVIDTGVQADHPDLQGQVLPGINFSGTQDQSDTSDTNGHGTHVAGVIAAKENNSIGVAGIAPSAKILPVKVVNSEGMATTSAIANGVLWSTNQGADAINISIVAVFDDPVLHAAIQYATSRNSVVVAAAGNYRSQGSPTAYPAAYPEVLAVASGTKQFTIGSSSNIGNYIDITAPGLNIVSTYKDSQYITLSGTSMASPHVAGLVADLRALCPSISVPQLMQTIENTATDMGSTGLDNESGYGFINPTAAFAVAASLTTNPLPPFNSTMFPTRTTTTMLNKSPIFSGNTVNLLLQVTNAVTKAPVPNAMVTVNLDNNTCERQEFVRSTDKTGSIVFSFPAYKTTFMFTYTPTVIGRYYGSDDIEGMDVTVVNPVSVAPCAKQKTTAKGKITKHRIVLTLKPKASQQLTIQYKAGRKWVFYQNTVISKLSKLRLFKNKKTYRVLVEEWGKYSPVTSKSFSGR